MYNLHDAASLNNEFFIRKQSELINLGKIDEKCRNIFLAIFYDLC